MIAWSMILSHWRAIALAALVAGNVSFFKLWRSEVHSFDQYKTEAHMAAAVAEAKAKEVEALHQKTLEDIGNAWNNSLPQVRAGAVAAYIRAHPSAGLQQSAGSGQVPNNAQGAQGTDATGQECLPPEQFIRDAAEDAAKIGAWQAWAAGNQLVVE